MAVKWTDIIPLPDKRGPLSRRKRPSKTHQRLVESVRESDRLKEQIRAEVSSLEDLLREWKD